MPDMLRKSRIVLLGGHLLLIAILWTGPAWGQRIRFPTANVAVAQAPASPPAWTARLPPPPVAPALCRPCWRRRCRSSRRHGLARRDLDPQHSMFDPTARSLHPCCPHHSASGAAGLFRTAEAYRPPRPATIGLFPIVPPGPSGNRPAPISDCFNTRGSVTWLAAATRQSLSMNDVDIQNDRSAAVPGATNWVSKVTFHFLDGLSRPFRPTPTSRAM
jgi:hypothetical protein